MQCPCLSPLLLMRGCPVFLRAPPEPAESPALHVILHYLMGRLQTHRGLCKCHLGRILTQKQLWLAYWAGSWLCGPPLCHPSDASLWSSSSPEPLQHGCFCSSPCDGREHLEGSPRKTFELVSAGRCVTQIVFSPGSLHLIFPNHIWHKLTRPVIAIYAVQVSLGPGEGLEVKKNPRPLLWFL